MRHLFSAFGIGALFGTGLIVAGMTNPAKVLNFLDLFGNFDPSLAFVMGGAVFVTFIGFRLLRLRRGGPVFGDRYAFPETSVVDRRLVIGSLLFGAGWGLAGLCPGPAIAVLPMAPVSGSVFTAGLLLGIAAFTAVGNRRGARPNAATAFTGPSASSWHSQPAKSPPEAELGLSTEQGHVRRQR